MELIKRDPFFDVVKLFAIFMVVFWHVVGELCSSETYASLRVVDNFRVGVNMPVFFALSGYFAAPTLLTVDLVKLARHIRSYLWPFAVVSILFAFLAVSCGLTNVAGVPLYALKRFLFAGWFIWSLVTCYVLTFGSCWLAKRLQTDLWKVLAVACLLLFLVPPFGCLGWYHFAYTRSQIGFFLFGVFVLRRCPLWQRPVIGLVSFIAYVVLAFAVPRFSAVGLSFYHANDILYSFMFERWALVSFAARQLIGYMAIVGVMYMLSVFSRIAWLANRLAVLGTTTLGVYVLHQWLLERVAVWKGGGLSIEMAFVCACLLFAFCHLVTFVTMRIRWMRKFVWGKLG